MTGRKQKLTRPRTGRMLSGVCAGLANFFGLDVSIIRIVYVILTFVTAFAGIPIYLLMWIIIPQEPNHYFHD